MTNEEKKGLANMINVIKSDIANEERAARQVERHLIERVRRAVRDPGKYPEWKAELQARHRMEWPTLWNALDELLRVAQ